MCTTTCHINEDYNLEVTKGINNMPQSATSWSTPCTTQTLGKPQITWNFSKHINSS